MSDSVVVSVTVTAPAARHPSSSDKTTTSIGRPATPSTHSGSLPYTGFPAVEAVIVAAVAVVAGIRLALVRRSSRRGT